MRRLLPLDAVGTVTVEQVADGPRRRGVDRPWVMACMIASVDGSASLGGRSGGLGAASDAALLGALRRRAQVVLVGAGTARTEGYGPPRSPGLRIAVVTNSGDVDVDSDLFRSGAGLVIAPRRTEVHGAEERGVEVLRCGEETVDLAAALAALDAEVVQLEGGPTLNGAMVAADLVDEWNVTISPSLVGGDGPRLVTNADEAKRPLRLVQLVEDGSMLFGRWLRR